MSRTTRNRRKKENRRWRCYWCGKSGHDAPDGICYISYLLPDSDGRAFCSDECVGKFNDANERLRKNHVVMIGDGNECKVFKGGEYVGSIPVRQRQAVIWDPLS